MCIQTSSVLAGLIFIHAVCTARDLSQKELKLLQDPGGWEYVSVGDQDSGIQTQHTCFDGKPHPDECSGKLTFTPTHTFVQNVYIHHQTVQRRGTYELSGSEISFYDELGTRDGPYEISVDSAQKTMSLKMPQIQIQLMLGSAHKTPQKQNPSAASGTPP